MELVWWLGGRGLGPGGYRCLGLPAPGAQALLRVLPNTRPRSFQLMALPFHSPCHPVCCSWGTSWGVSGYLYMLRTPWGAAAPKSQYWAGIYSAFYALAS